MNYLSNAILLSDHKIIKEQILDFEQKSGIQIPPVFRAFLENYDLPSFSTAIFNTFFSPDYKDYFTFEKVIFKSNPEIVFYDFLPPSKYIEAKNNVYHYEEDEEIIKDKICIGNIAGGLLLLGHGESNADIIYADKIGDDKRLHEVGENIFNYLRNITLEIDEKELQRFNIEAKDLYRNWGEKKWQIIKTSSI